MRHLQPLEVRDQARSGRFPPQLPSRLRAGGGHVVIGKHRKPSEIGLGLIRGDGFDRVVYNPATTADAERIKSLMKRKTVGLSVAANTAASQVARMGSARARK